MDDLVSTQWLADHLGDPDLVILDATIVMPGDPRQPREEYRQSHIPGARYFDIEALSDGASPFPHMLPSGAEFAEAMEKLGVGSDDRIIVYDHTPLRSATRAWFMLRHFGASRVGILDGGLGKWLGEGRAVDDAPPEPRAAGFTVREAGDVVAKHDLIAGAGEPVLDARGAGRFEGRDPDPRPGVAAGHIVGSRNLPFAALYRDDGTLRPDEELRAAFAATGVEPDAPFIASCGSGVTATSLMFAAHRLGGRSARLYDGSWSEYGADPAAPKALGPA